MNKGRFGIGGNSLILIFMIISLSTFCLLSLSIAQRDVSRADRIGEKVKEYYKSDLEGEIFLEEALYDKNKTGIIETDIELSENRDLHIKVNKQDNNLEILNWNVINKDIDIDQNIGVIILD